MPKRKLRADGVSFNAAMAACVAPLSMRARIYCRKFAFAKCLSANAKCSSK